MTLMSATGCPVVISNVLQIAGMDAGGMSTAQAPNLMRGDGPGTVTVKLSRGGKEFTAVIERQHMSSIVERNGKKLFAGFIGPADTTEAEIKRVLALDGSRIGGRIFFPSHYPTDLDVYYGGFELMLLIDPEETFVTGIEDGPASRAGLHTGDNIVSVNGTNLTGKTAAQVEQLLSNKRAEPVELKIDRLGAVRTIKFTLERASDVMQASGKRMVSGHLVAAGLSDDDVRCQAAAQK